MITKIAFFGSEDMTTRVMEYASAVTEIEVVPYVYQSAEEIAHLISQASATDIYLFSGVLPYFFAKKSIGTFDKPSVYIEDNELNIALTLLEISNKKTAELDRISFDLPNRELLDLITTGLDIYPKPVFVTDYSWLDKEFTKEFLSNDLLNTHIELWESNRIDFVVTSIHSLHDKLLQMQIPCMRMIDPKKNIIDALEEAKSLGVLQQTKDSQVAVGLISLSVTNDSIIRPETHDFLAEKLQSLTKQINCTVQREEVDSYALYGTKGGIEYLLKNLHLLDDIKNYATETNVTVSIGFGFGMTIIEAEKNAHIALSYSKSNKQKPLSIYTVTENKMVMDSQACTPKHFVLQSQNEQLIQLAKEIGISVTNLNKMIQFTNSRPINRFTSSDIVDYFEITKRSAERILKKFSDCGYLKIIGEEQPFQHGRPRSVYRLDLPTELINKQIHLE